MAIRPSTRDLSWFALGASIFLAGAVAMLVFHGGNQDWVRRLASKSRSIEAVAAVQAALGAASEAETSAVLAVTDLDSQKYARQARAATARAERERANLAHLLQIDGSQSEKDLLDRFSRKFSDFQRVSADVLALSVLNSNLKAFALAFGPARQALEQMESALSRLVGKAGERSEVVRLACRAEKGALRIEVLLAPHIAEEGENKMDELEVAMDEQDEAVKGALARLALVREVARNSDLRTASASYARFGELRTQILALSRENTNVRSTALLLREKREIFLVCQDILKGLEEAIQAELPNDKDYGRFGQPIRIE